MWRSSSSLLSSLLCFAPTVAVVGVERREEEVGKVAVPGVWEVVEVSMIVLNSDLLCLICLFNK